MAFNLKTKKTLISLTQEIWVSDTNQQEIEELKLVSLGTIISHR